MDAIAKGSGGAGFDGWHSKELKMLVKLAPWIVEELYELWKITSRYLVYASACDELKKMIAHWRVVGIPKKDPQQKRPIGVGSCLPSAGRGS